MKQTNKSESEALHSSECQLVALELGGEVFGVDIGCIHTVLMPQAITSVPKTPEYVKGVMNLRGQILPVIDLRIRFGLTAEAHGKMRIVIVDVGGVMAGLIVDAVSEVLRLSESNIESPTALMSSVASDYIIGVGQTADTSGNKENPRLIMLLDVAKIIVGSLGDTDLTKIAA